MNYPVNAYLDALNQQTPRRLTMKTETKQDFLAWQDELRPAFNAALGTRPQRGMLRTKLLEERAFPGYRRQLLEMEQAEHLVMPFYLLIPDDIAPGEKRPGVVAVPGHGTGMADALGIDEAGNFLEDPGYQKRFPEELCRRGFVVLVPELMGFGWRRCLGDEEKPMNHSACHAISTALLTYGQTLAGMRVFDVMRSLDYLETLDSVDAGRLGVMGISGGGLAAAFTAMVDQRIRAVCVSGYLNTFTDSILNVFHCVDNYLPGIMTVAELPDLAGLIAPRPLIMEAGTEDPIFPIAASLACYEKLKSANLTASSILSLSAFTP